jgi:hypothetical protein
MRTVNTADTESLLPVQSRDGVYSRYSGSELQSSPAILTYKIILGLTRLAELGYKLPDIANMVETRVRNPNAILSLGQAYTVFAAARVDEMRKAQTRQPILPISRRKVKRSALVDSIVERIALRCDILWSMEP